MWTDRLHTVAQAYNNKNRFVANIPRICSHDDYASGGTIRRWVVHLELKKKVIIKTKKIKGVPVYIFSKILKMTCTNKEMLFANKKQGG